MEENINNAKDLLDKLSFDVTEKTSTDENDGKSSSTNDSGMVNLIFLLSRS